MRHIAYLSLVFVLGAAACAPQVPRTSGKQIFQENCARCHGASARGDGPLASRLGQPPADLTMLRHANGGVFPAADVMAKIHGYAKFHNFDDMPSFGQRLAGPTVDWISPSGKAIATPQALVDLVAYLESVQQDG